MKTHKILMLALLAVFAFSAVLAATASAEATLLAEWLVAGAAVPVNTATTTTAGTIKLGDTTFGATVECTGKFDGVVNQKENNGEDLTELVLNAAGVERSLAAPFLVSTGECKNVSGCSTTQVTEVAPEGLPWETLMYLDETSGLFLDFVVKASYAVTCTILGIKTTDECTVEKGTFELVAAAEGAEAKGKVEPLGNCSIGGKEKGEEEFVGANHLLNSLSEPMIPSSGA